MKSKFKVIKKTAFCLLKFVITLLGALLLYLIIAFLLSCITVHEEEGALDQVAIYILTNGLHTDIVVPSRTTQIDWTTKISPPLRQENPESLDYLALGWGDKGFYLETPTWADLKFSTAFKAAFGLSTSAIHATYYSIVIESEDCIKINISQEQYSRLIEYIDQSLEKSHAGTLIKINTTANYGSTDSFYEANGRYSLFWTCNSWANKGLKYSGQEACLWTAFDQGIFNQYK